MINNFKQLHNQIKANRIRASGYGKRNIHKLEDKFQNTIKQMENLVGVGKSQVAMFLANKGLRLSKEGLYHYRHYQTNQLIIYLTFMWLGWIGFLLFSLNGIPKKPTKIYNKISLLALVNFIFLIMFILLFIEHNCKTLILFSSIN